MYKKASIIRGHRVYKPERTYSSRGTVKVKDDNEQNQRVLCTVLSYNTCIYMIMLINKDASTMYMYVATPT